MIGSQRKRHVAAVEAAAAGAPPNQAVIENFSPLDRLAVKVTDRVGTMSFFLVIFAWTLLWVGYNVLASKVPALHWHAFDPFPAFVAYLLISNGPLSKRIYQEGSPEARPILRLLAKATFGIYLIHPLILELFYFSVYIDLLHRPLPPSWELPALVMVTLLVSSMIVIPLTKIPVLKNLVS